MRTFAILIVTALAVLPAPAQCRFSGRSDSAPPPLVNTDVEQRILAVLAQMRQNGTTHLSVPPSADARRD